MEPAPQVTCPHCGRRLAVDQQKLAQAAACPHCGQPVVPFAACEARSTLSPQETYNVVSDLGTGVNVRWKDNVFQLVAIVVATALGALVGALVTEERLLGALAGGFVGVLVGLFGSGVALMIYRAVRHMGGHHE